jgi:hypothetical protein
LLRHRIILRLLDCQINSSLAEEGPRRSGRRSTANDRNQRWRLTAKGNRLVRFSGSKD